MAGYLSTIRGGASVDERRYAAPVSHPRLNVPSTHFAELIELLLPARVLDPSQRYRLLSCRAAVNLLQPFLPPCAPRTACFYGCPRSRRCLRSPHVITFPDWSVIDTIVLLKVA